MRQAGRIVQVVPKHLLRESLATGKTPGHMEVVVSIHVPGLIHKQRCQRADQQACQGNERQVAQSLSVAHLLTDQPPRNGPG